MNTNELIADLKNLAEVLKTPIGAVHKTLMEAAGRLEQLQVYKTLFNNALNCVDQVFQHCSEIPNPILPDFANPGEDKFRAVIRLASDYKTLCERLEELQAVIAELVEALEVPDSGQYRVYEVLDWSEFIEAKEACK